jgi:hypothetical protein
VFNQLNFTAGLSQNVKLQQAVIKVLAGANPEMKSEGDGVHLAR